MSQEYLKYLNSSLKSKVQNLLLQSSSLSNDEKSIIIEILNYFNSKFEKLQNDYDKLLNKNDLSIANNKKRSFNNLINEGSTQDTGSDHMLIDSDEPKALPTNQYNNFVSLPQPQKPKFNPTFYSIKNIIHDVSFMNPRRTYHVVITNDAFIIIYPNGNYIELIIPFSYILEIICVTIPETASKQWCFSLVVNLEYHSNVSNNTNSSSIPHEIFIFKLIDNKNLKVYEPLHSSNDTTAMETSQLDTFGFQPVTNTPTNKDYLITLLKNYLWPNSSKTVIEPDVATFVSKKKIMSSHSKNKKNHKFHINCYYKAKEGFLFLLKEGIFYGAKKPSLYFPMSSILSIKVTNVTSRTFNLNIRRRQSSSSSSSLSSSSSMTPSNKKFKSEKGGNNNNNKSNDDSSNNTEEENFEFSMIDSVEFDGIMEYIRQHKTEWSTNRNGEFGMNTGELEESEQNQKSGDENDNDNGNGNDNGNNNKGEDQNIFTFVDEDESNDEDYHPDLDSDAGDSSDSSDSDSDSDAMDKEQEKLDIENDKKLLKSMNKDEIEEEEEEEEELEEEQENKKKIKPKAKRTRKTQKKTSTSTATTTTTTTEKKKRKTKTKNATTKTNNQDEDIVMKDNNIMSDDNNNNNDNNKKENEDEEDEINEISSNVEEISLSKSPTKRSKRKASNPKKLTKAKASSTTSKRKTSSTKINSNSNTNTNTNKNVSVHQDTKKNSITSPKPKNQTKQLTMYDIFNRKPPTTPKNKNTSKEEEEENVVEEIHDEEEDSIINDDNNSNVTSSQATTEATNSVQQDTNVAVEEDEDDEEDEILFE